MNAIAVKLPEDISIGTFRPFAYYDKQMDCIRVVTHDRSVTEHRINEWFTVHECNRPADNFDPPYVGFTIKGVRYLFSEVGLPLDGVYRLAELIDKIVSYRPGSTMSETLRLIFSQYPDTGDIEVNLAEAA